MGEHFDQVFRTITTDNGFEFTYLPRLELGTKTRIYYAHPYTSCEKGTIENHNGLVWRFIRKGRQISDYSDDVILGAELWTNGLPRKILDYMTPEKAFDMELDWIFAD